MNNPPPETRMFSQDNMKYKDIRYRVRGRKGKALLGILTFSLPAFRLTQDCGASAEDPSDRYPVGRITCPGAFLCIKGCYALTNNFTRWERVVNKAHRAFRLSLTGEFEDAVKRELSYYHATGVKPWQGKLSDEQRKAGMKAKTHKRRPLHLVRIHDSGDFYSPRYIEKWLRIMKWAETEMPGVGFWAYTKAVKWMKEARERWGEKFPRNFTIVYSEGGIEDSEIDHAHDRFSRVFMNRRTLKKQGFEEGSSKKLGDIKACFGSNRKNGIVYHSGATPFVTDPNDPAYPLSVQAAKDHIRKLGLEKFYTGRSNPKSSPMLAALLIPGIPPL